MSVPNQYGTQQQSPGGGKTAILVVLLAAGLMAGLCCAGMCGGLAFFYTAVEGSRIAEEQLQKDDVQTSVTPPDVMDWIVRAQLSRAYTKALDTVTADKNVIAALGDAVDSTNDPAALFRRTNSGQLQGEETIEFDIEGQRGAAVVKVVCAPPAISPPGAMPGGFEGGYQPQKITVTLRDGMQINVPAPTAKSAQ